MFISNQTTQNHINFGAKVKLEAYSDSNNTKTSYEDSFGKYPENLISGLEDALKIMEQSDSNDTFIIEDTYTKPHNQRVISLSKETKGNERENIHTWPFTSLSKISADDVKCALLEYSKTINYSLKKYFS